MMKKANETHKTNKVEYKGERVVTDPVTGRDVIVKDADDAGELRANFRHPLVLHQHRRTCYYQSECRLIVACWSSGCRHQRGRTGPSQEGRARTLARATTKEPKCLLDPARVPEAGFSHQHPAAAFSCAGQRSDDDLHTFHPQYTGRLRWWRPRCPVVPDCLQSRLLGFHDSFDSHRRHCYRHLVCDWHPWPQAGKGP